MKQIDRATPAALLLLATLATACADEASAASLYRWIEPDGSITFSPTPPSDGTAYVEVDATTLQAPRRGADAPEARTTPPVVRAPMPTLGAAAVGAADVGGEGGTDPGEDRPWGDPAVRSFGRAANGGLSGSDREREDRCGELRKRVVSLERRLQSALTPEQMDDTVLRMAQYQRNFDDHCR